MRFFSLFLITLFVGLSSVWETDFDKAVEKAQQEHKLILLSFSGSDWCIPCIRLHKEVFDNNSFNQYAENNLILVNADFPRLKKNQLSKDQQKQNDKLAEKYNPEGIFPLTVLINEQKNVLMRWDGDHIKSPEQFVGQLKSYTDAGK